MISLDRGSNWSQMQWQAFLQMRLVNKKLSGLISYSVALQIHSIANKINWNLRVIQMKIPAEKGKGSLSFSLNKNREFFQMITMLISQ